MRATKILVDHYHHICTSEEDQWVAGIQDKLDLILSNQGIIMEELAELKAVLATIMETVGHVSADTDNILAKLASIPTAGLPDDVKAAISDSLTAAKAIAERLKAVDAKVEDAPTA